MHTNLNKLLVCHISTVKCLLVVNKAWKLSLLNFLTTQHQHSGGKTYSWDKIRIFKIDPVLIWHSAQTLTVSDPQKTAPACHLSLCLPQSGEATDLEGNLRVLDGKGTFSTNLQRNKRNAISRRLNYSICQMLTCWRMYRLQITLEEPLII